MEKKTLQIYFTSDIHAFIYPTDYRSPGERDMGLLKCANQFDNGGNALVIDGGDSLQGSPFGAFCHDSLGSASSLAEIMNACGYNYITLGNHDFNYGVEYLDTYLKSLNARCVCQNVLSEDGGECFPCKIHEMENGLRIGIVGIVTDYVNVWERPEHLKGIKVTDPFSAAKDALDKLRGRADITACIYHGGFECDIATGRRLSQTTENIAYRICKELDFDILLTGHQHMCMSGQSLFGTYIVQAPDSGKAFIRLEATVSSFGKSYISHAIPAGGYCSPFLLEGFKAIEHGTQKWLDVEIGKLKKPLMPESHLAMAYDGSDIADFINEVQMTFSGAQISACSLANDAAGLPEIVRRRDVLAAYPYPNTLVVIQVTGDILRQAIERSAEYFDLDEEGNVCISNAFLEPKIEHYNYDYYAGVEYAIDASRPIGSRVVKLMRNGKPVNDDDKFSMCLNNYRASGTGGYDMYRQCPVLKEINTEMTDLILEYFEHMPEASIKSRCDS